MNATWKPTVEQLKRKRRRRLLLCVVLLVAAGLAAMLSCSLPSDGKTSLTATQTPASQPAAEQSNPVALDQPTPSPDSSGHTILSRTIAEGDNLSAIFDSCHIDQTTLFAILAADESLLALDILRPGNRLTFKVEESSGQLAEMALYINPAHQVVYRRTDDTSFESEEVVIPGTWENQIIEAEIDASFYLSAMAAGLSEQEAGNITHLFKNKLNFSRDIRPGDRFQIIRSLQLVDDTLTGQSHIEAIRIFARNHSYAAFLFSDGNYYDEKGESLARAFRRYPFNGRHRISSAFNPKRLHPVTGRIAPHRGVDFAMPTGTPILAAADGEITRVKNHPYAGKYVEIKHDGQYLSRYMHLSRVSVYRGQKVKRGEVIARSGNTGRSTGPHLHYELHIKGRAVNPLTAAIPTATKVPKNQLAEFRQHVQRFMALLDDAGRNFVGA